VIAAAKLVSAGTQRVEVIGFALIVCLLIFELLRRKRLLERYAIVWFVAGVSVLVLAVWKGLLTTLSHAVGIYYPPSMLFAVTFVFVLVMLVNFSTTLSRLSDQNNVLAQRVALLQHRLGEQDHAGLVGNQDAGDTAATGARSPGQPVSAPAERPAGEQGNTSPSHGL
jgi:hypothetical protein